MLIDTGSRLISDRNLLGAVLTGTGIDLRNILLEGPPLVFWKSLVEHADSFNKVDVLMSALIQYNPGNAEIQKLNDQIEASSMEAMKCRLKSVINSKDCVLFIGPEFLQCRQGREIISFNKYFSRKLAETLNKENIFFEEQEDENLSYIIDRFETWDKMPGETARQAEKIYNSGIVLDSYYENLFDLGFPLIINTNPDLIMPGLPGRHCDVDYYDLTNNPLKPKFAGLKPGRTMVYNIFGSFANPYSVLFTEKQAVSFSRMTYEKNPPIPEEIKEMVSNTHGLFAGFDFKDWHFKILFDVLSLRNQEGNFSLTDNGTTIMEKHKEYYERQYNMTFIRNDFTNLLEDLK